MEIITGKIKSAQKVVIYGPEGIGKSTFASKFPSPIFIDTEGSTKHLDVPRTKRPSSWTMLMEQVKEFAKSSYGYKTLVIDTADWAEKLCSVHVCARKEGITGIEDFGFGKGYTYLEEEFGRFINLLEDVIENGMNVVLTAHAALRKVDQPDEIGSYDRYEFKLQKKTAPLVKEWADMVLFATYKINVVNIDNQGAAKGKNKAQGGKRIMYATHHTCWDAKNRHDLPDEMPLDYANISYCIPDFEQEAPQASAPVPPPPPAPEEASKTAANTEPPTPEEPPSIPSSSQEPPPTSQAVVVSTTQAPAAPPDYVLPEGIPKALADLMGSEKVTEQEIQTAMSEKGYYPEDTPIKNYDPEFIEGVLIGAWPQVFKFIEDGRDIPF